MTHHLRILNAMLIKLLYATSIIISIDYWSPLILSKMCIRNNLDDNSNKTEKVGVELTFTFLSKSIKFNFIELSRSSNVCFQFTSLIETIFSINLSCLGYII